jgi:NADPH2:quinone reductase
MKAILVKRFGGPDVLSAAEIPTPEPAEGEIRIRLRAAGVNPVETYIRSGNYTAGLPTLPYTPGTDGAGIVDAVGRGGGEASSCFKRGDRVYLAGAISKRMTGTYAQYAVCDACAVFHLPEDLSFEQGAGLGTPGLTACQALFRRARIESGETVLIHGASGGVGSLAVQLAKLRGAIVYATTGSEAGAEMLRDLGISRIFNHNDKDCAARILESTNNRGVDAIVEMLANANLDKDLEMLAERGRIAIVGNRGVLEFNPRHAMLKDASILGVMLKNMRDGELNANIHALSAALSCGVKVLISSAYRLEDAAKAHADIIAGKGRRGKLVLSIE